MKTSFREMRVFVLFDLPSVTKSEKKIYVAFRKALLADGFIMMQFSIYTRFCTNIQDANKHIKRVEYMAPDDGNIRILSVTEHQYNEMILVIGDISETERIVKCDYLVMLE